MKDVVTIVWYFYVAFVISIVAFIGFVVCCIFASNEINKEDIDCD